MLDVKDYLAAQERIRLGLLDNGYSPLPIKNKMCLMKGWGTMPLSREVVEGWTRKRAYLGSAVRVENGLCVVDLDIDDAEVCKEIFRKVEDAFPQFTDAPVRFGGGAKEAWFVRIDPAEAFSVLHTATFAPPGEDPEGEGVVTGRVEVFGGASHRLMGSFGAHTVGRDGVIEREYRWLDGFSLLDMPLLSLPLIRKSHLLDVLDIARSVIEAAGWVRVPRSKAGEASTTPIYDLHEDMVFDCIDGVSRGLDDLPGYFEDAGWGQARCSAAWLGDPSLRNRSRCLISVDGDGLVSILETASYERHLPLTAAARDRPIFETVSALGEKMRQADIDLSKEPMPALIDDAKFWQNTRRMLAEWAWCPDRASRPVVPIYQPEERSMSVQNGRTTQLPNRAEYLDDKGKEKTISPFDVWLASQRRVEVVGYRYLPGKAPGVYDTPDGTVINSYRAPTAVPPRDLALRDAHEALWVEFITHLLPDAREREWFLDWLAHKAQNPTEPGVAVLMVAPRTYGVGRGTLADLIGVAFGEHNVREVSSRLLMGDQSQAQYTDWMVNCLIVTVPEVLPDGEAGSGMDWKRRKTYERLKEILDPRARRIQVVRKGLPNYQDMTYASFLMASNHENALPLPEGDRRVAVLTNSGPPLADVPALKGRIDAVRHDAVFGASLLQWLLARDVSGYSPQIVPETAGNAAMVTASVSEVQYAVDAMLSEWPLDWAPVEVLSQRAREVAARHGIDDEGPKTRRHLMDALSARWVTGPDLILNGRHTRTLIKDVSLREALAAEDSDALAAALSEATGGGRVLKMVKS